MNEGNCRRNTSHVAAGLTLILALSLGPAILAAPEAECNGQINIRYISGPAFGTDGDIYRVELGLGTGSISNGPGASNTLSLSTVRFFLDCTFQGLPGCVDDGNVVNFIGNITTTCGTQQPNFWIVSQGGNSVDFTAQSPVVIPALTPAFPGFCQLQFDIQVASTAAARDDLPQTPNRVEELVSYPVATCDNGLPSTGSQSAAFDICPACDDGNLCTADICDTATGTCTNPPNVTCNDNNFCTNDVCNPATGTCVYTPGVFCNDNDACTSDVCNPATGTCVYTPTVFCNDNNACTLDICNPVTGTCVYTPNVFCNDNDACTSDVCNPVTGSCVYTPTVFCNDGNFCTLDICNPVTGTCVYTPNVVCNDNNFCTSDQCNPVTGQCVYTPTVFCNDNNFCTSDLCNPATGTCVYTPNVVCNDNNFCTSDLCNPATGTCVYTPNVVCNDNNQCTSDVCNPVTGNCVYTPTVFCNDNNACTNDVCNPVTGNCVYTPSVVCNDNDACTNDVCNPATGQCVYTPGPPCDDNDVCTDDVCNPQTGQCVYTPNELCQEICRTPGFWGTHADQDPAKRCSQDITGAVITMGGGSLNICGECITNQSPGTTLPPNNAASAVEALCVRVKGQQTRQLARQLTAAALNCIISGFPANCAGSSISTLFADCNIGCAVASGNAPGPAPVGFNVGACISAIDCFNNGFRPGSNGECGDSTGCHERALPLGDIFPGGTLCNGRQGPAGSSGECSAANESGCTIIQPGEGNCSADACP